MNEGDKYYKKMSCLSTHAQSDIRTRLGLALIRNPESEVEEACTWDEYRRPSRMLDTGSCLHTCTSQSQAFGFRVGGALHHSADMCQSLISVVHVN